MRGKIELFGLDTLVNMIGAAGLHIEMRISDAAWSAQTSSSLPSINSMNPIIVGWVERAARTLVRSGSETHRRAAPLMGFAKGSNPISILTLLAMTLKRRRTITAAVANELSTSLRAKRGNPEQRKQDWNASSQELLAMTWRGHAIIARHLRADLSTSSSLRRQHRPPDQLALLQPVARWANWSRRCNPPLDGSEEAGYGFAYNPPYGLSRDQNGAFDPQPT
jgi:hypothetical protein